MNVSRALAGLVVVVGLIVTGCSSTVTGNGSFTTASPGPSGSGSVTPTPSESLTPEQAQLRGQLREGHRLAGVTVRTDTVFPQFTDVCQPTGTFYNVDALTAFGGVFDDSVVPTLTEGGYVTGYGMCRRNGDARSLISAVFEMKSADAAFQAVKKLAQTLQTKGAILAPIAGYNGSYTVEQVNITDYVDETKKTNVVQRLVPQGQLIHYVYGRSPDIKTGRNAVARTMIAQLAQAKDFTVTPPDKLTTLDDDPEGLRGKHVSFPGDLTPDTGGYDPQAYLALSEDPATEKAALTAAGFTEYFSYVANNKEEDGRYVTRAVGLYKLRDEAGAQQVQQAFVGIDKRINQNIRIVDLSSVPGSFCFATGTESGQISQRCFFSKGPVLAQVDVYNATRKFADVTEITKIAQDQYGRL